MVVVGEFAIDQRGHRHHLVVVVVVGVTVTVTVRDWVARLTRHYLVPARPAWAVAGP